MDKKKKIYISIILSIIFIFSAIFFGEKFKNENTEKVAEKFQATLYDKEQTAEQIILNIFNVFDQLPSYSPNIEEINTLITEKDIEILVYYRDSLKYWSDNKIPGKINYQSNLFKKHFAKFNNAYFDIIKINKNGIRVIGLILVKHEYPYQNKYLVNDFQKDFDVPTGTSIEIENGGNNEIYSKNGEKLFSLKMPINSSFSEGEVLLLFILYLAAFTFFAIFLLQLYKQIPFTKRNNVLLIIFFGVDILIIRAIIQIFHIPEVLYSSSLFDYKLFSMTALFPSIGDLIVSYITIFIITYV